jgi:acylphosphatase
MAQLGISAVDQAALAAVAANLKGHAWNVDDGDVVMTTAQRSLVRRFKASLKKHFYKIGQGRYCCYCGEVLHEHQGTYDVEHLICKADRSKLVFELRNLALVCKPCNVAKGTQRIRVFVLDDTLDDLSEGSDKYRIFHPHFDAWSKHFAVDEFKRTVAIDGNGLTKGRTTLNMCGIHRKNGMALSDHFNVFKSSVGEHDDWLLVYSVLAAEEDISRRRKVRNFVRDVLRAPSDPAGQDLLALLEPLLPAP